MPEAPEHSLTLEDAFLVPGELCRAYATSDLRLLSEGLHDLSMPTRFGVPTLYTAPRFDAKLRFESSVSKDKNILFGLIKRSRSERVAALSIEMQVAPTPDAGTGESTGLQVYGTWPRFFEAPVKLDSMTLRLGTGVKLTLSLPAVGGSARQLNGRVSLMGPMMIALGEWARSADALPAAPQNTHDIGAIDPLLRTLIGGTHRILRDAEASLKAGDENKPSHKPVPQDTWSLSDHRSYVAARIGPEFTNYEIAELTSRLKLVLDQDGDLATDPFSGRNQRFDVEAKLKIADGVPRVVCTLRVPDLLISGPVYRQILTELAEAEQLESLLRSAARLSTVLRGAPKDSLVAYIQAAARWGQAVIARIERTKKGADRDLVLLAGELNGQSVDLLISLKITFKERDVAEDALRIEQLEDFDLLAFRSGDGVWQAVLSDDDDACEYFYQAFTSLYRWRLRFGPLGDAS